MQTRIGFTSLQKATATILQTTKMASTPTDFHVASMFADKSRGHFINVKC